MARREPGDYALISSPEVVMLEVVILFKLGSRIAERAKAKGLSSTAFVLLLLGLWFGGGFGGSIVAAIASVILNPHEDISFGLMYIAYLVCAGGGAFMAFKIVDWQQGTDLWSPPALEEEVHGIPPATAAEPVVDDRIQDRPR